MTEPRIQYESHEAAMVARLRGCVISCTTMRDVMRNDDRPEKRKREDQISYSFKKCKAKSDTRRTKTDADSTSDEERVSVDVGKSSNTAEDCTDQHRVAVESDAPSATEVVVDVVDEGTSKDAGHVARGVEEANGGQAGVAEVLVPGVQSLESRNDGS